MRREMPLIVILLGVAATAFAQSSDPKVWVGKYAHSNDIGKEYFMLEIFRDGNKLKGRYKETITAQTTNKLSLDITVKGNIASFYLADCLPLSKTERGEAGRNSCGEEGGYKHGDLILKVQKNTKGKRVSFKALGGKLTEAGFAGELDFVRVGKFFDIF